jgi:hypothetical protein
LSFWCLRAGSSSPDWCHGRLLSIVEASDELGGTCRPLLDRAPAGSVTREIELELGDGHGAFFTPRDGWVEPTLEWALGG